VLLVFFLARFVAPSFSTRWRGIKDGMTQAEVRKALGTPTWTGTSGTIGAGNKEVTRWEYKHGLARYHVDFDYIGPHSTPLVFRTERSQKDWDWLWWRLWGRSRVRY
jgi:hypothetical protein